MKCYTSVSINKARLKLTRKNFGDKVVDSNAAVVMPAEMAKKSELPLQLHFFPCMSD